MSHKKAFSKKVRLIYREELSSGEQEFTGEMYTGEFTSGKLSKGYFSTEKFADD